MTAPKSGPVFVSFVGGDAGRWRIESIAAVAGEGLSTAERLEVVESAALPTSAAPHASTTGVWALHGVTSNPRYTTRSELDGLRSRQEGLGRAQATRAALIPIRKNAAWWGLAQDERRAILEEQSHHIATGIEYLPSIARRLHHSRELAEPFDFLTWFEYAPEDCDAFERLVGRLRETKEWEYVEREVDIRLMRE